MKNINLIISENIKKFINEVIVSDLTLYHGTPWDFIKFQTKNIGSGEGNQSFGYGLYFTDNKNVAQYYAEKLAKPNGFLYTIKVKNGNFFEWNERLDDVLKNKIITYFKEKGIEELPIKRVLGKNGIETITEPIEEAILKYPNGKFLYENLSNMLGGDLKATQLLQELGYDGIIYPIGQNSLVSMGGGMNYVIFDGDLVEIINKQKIK